MADAPPPDATRGRRWPAETELQIHVRPFCRAGCTGRQRGREGGRGGQAGTGRLGGGGARETGTCLSDSESALQEQKRREKAAAGWLDLTLTAGRTQQTLSVCLSVDGAGNAFGFVFCLIML